MAQAQYTQEDQAAFNEVMQLLEATPDTAEPTGIVNLGFTPDANDIPAKRKKLAILVSTGKSKEAIGVQLTHEQVKRLSDKEVEKYNKRQEAYIGSKTTESLIDSFLLLASKGLGLVVKVVKMPILAHFHFSTQKNTFKSRKQISQFHQNNFKKFPTKIKSRSQKTFQITTKKNSQSHQKWIEKCFFQF